MHDADASRAPASPRPAARRVRRRDRHGRGLRGLLTPPDVPLHRSRSEQFGDLVLEAVARLEPRWETQLSQVEFAVQEVPDAGPPGDAADPVPLARLDLPPDGQDASGHRGRPGRAAPRIVLYRRALLARADDEEELAALILDVVVEEFARLLGVDPEVVDPGYEED